MIPYGRQNITADDIRAVVDVLESDYLTQGPNVPKFEQAVAESVQADFAVAANSATSALHIACMALGVGKGDIVWTSPITFVASANCALYCGADVDFVDIDLETANMSIAALEKKLIEAKATNQLPKAVIPVHFSGQSCDMQAMAKLAREYGFAIIEDASHAIGAHYNQRPVGCCEFSDIAIFSFHPVKIITSAEGGMATTNSPDLASKMSQLRSHGITRDADLLTRGHDEAWYYEQHGLGHNYRMTELQGALGLSQMSQLAENIIRRNEIRKKYESAFSTREAVNHLTVNNNLTSSCHLFVIQVAAEQRLALYNHLRSHDIIANVHYIPVYHQPYYQNMNKKFDVCPNAETYYSQAISIPLFPQLTDAEQEFVVAKIDEFFEGKT